MRVGGGVRASVGHRCAGVGPWVWAGRGPHSRARKGPGTPGPATPYPLLSLYLLPCSCCSCWGPPAATGEAGVSCNTATGACRNATVLTAPKPGPGWL